MIRFLAIGALSLCAVAPAMAGSAALHSGKYEGLMLAVTPDHQVEGFYSESMGEGVSRGCTFYLQGKPGALTTWLDSTYPGSVAPSSDGVTLTVQEGRQHPGCLNVLMPEIATGLDLTQTANKQWIGLVTVSADKAYLQKAPGAKVAKRPYIVKNDVVGVLAFKDGWAQVEFINADDRSFTGWISQDQYSRLAVPTAQN
ncbi:hypothetical protein BFW88_20205 [Pseudomonas fluorescens]|uniref:SH3 domain-containing protein n=1 Tax=Pseudomonas lactucae TaxID=2813360 RepID=A0A9X0Y8V0_9PSED|nr:hypothetical protein [Pseudomonas lactucae]OPA87050.1 hypothetical protein BFW88_20205 [Pseudomonas fluorescens]MBN2975520.1 hypothetical protein [Pseudomonas lactucae]MBN2989136.1 hypothetical protein [Pseudomonas lactucae]OPB06624.1 hypothetical protein BFW92_20150 [Pseudomonas fluorescens]OPB17909.1 hypothetical protein BFW93_20180 [Pseudomonas fluorescens]